MMSVRKVAAMFRMSLFTLVLSVCGLAFAQSPDKDVVHEPGRVVFVCEHGSVKSLIASVYFNQRAQERGLPFKAVARGTAVESTVPPSVKDGLRAAGFDVSGYVPQPLRASDVKGASLVVSFDQDVTKLVDGRSPQLQWDNLPGVLADFVRGRDAILERVDALIDQLAKTSQKDPHHE
jgi:protein-tyrosine-phosphatase